MSEPVPPGVRTLAPEDQARADFYALLARLYADVPDRALIAAIAAASPLAPIEEAGDDAPGTTVAEAWRALIAASAAAKPDDVADEHQALFVGVGRSEVSLYASHYLGPQSGRPLGDIRASLAELGLKRRSESSQYEDHLASVLETMRMLVAGGAGREPADIGVQRAFFERHVASWAFVCCSAIEQSTIANYYLQVAQFTNSFLALERDSLAME